jgi:hypothetical protein
MKKSAKGGQAAKGAKVRVAAKGESAHSLSKYMQ